jgi:hypothetical protein
MKQLMIALLTILSISVFAEVKPDYSLIYDRCGKNTFAGLVTYGVPSAVCIAVENIPFNASHKAREVISYHFNNVTSINYLVLDSVFVDGNRMIVAQEVEIKSDSYGYDYIGPLSATDEVIDFVIYADQVIEGPNVSAELELMFQTESLF